LIAIRRYLCVIDLGAYVVEPAGSGENRIGGEDEGVGVELEVKSVAPLLVNFAMVLEQGEHVGVEGDLPPLARLGFLLLDPVVGLRVTAVHPERLAVEVDVAPAQGGDFPAARPVIMLSHSSRPDSGSDHASFKSAAASAALGGSGSVCPGAGASAIAAGLTLR
jgi:hypothetical protein